MLFVKKLIDIVNLIHLTNNLLYTLDIDKRVDEVIEISSRLASTTNEDDIKYDALRFLATAYKKKGEYEFTKATLNQIPEIYFKKLSEEAFLLSGVEKFNAANKQKWISLEMLLHNHSIDALKLYP